MSNATATKFFAVVTFGTSPSQKVFRSYDRANSVAHRCVGVGSCTTARVYECDTYQLARTADISVIRDGERIA